MTSALRKQDFGESVNLAVHGAFEAAILRATEVGFSKQSILDMISVEEWKVMDATNDDICVQDTDSDDC
ncbi:hypothetical protein [uncultured Paracoccus sp.]|uniref:hypothetical protein n=1 Tax=uncultured Paracoccus sp. TaxID=189685 RepID=UPI00260FAC48|nr:hypothetical protein [uncultured Paracoccus sp.]